MDSITLKNFRCFREEQTARLAPLTLLVGENSTGKTSFMAMIRVLWNASFWHSAPDFKEDPYDLGSFDEIAHHRGGRGSRAVSFKAGFNFTRNNSESTKDYPYHFEVTFGKKGAVPVLIKSRISERDVWIEFVREKDQSWQLRFRTPNAHWQSKVNNEIITQLDEWPLHFAILTLISDARRGAGREKPLSALVVLGNSVPPADEDWSQIEQLANAYMARRFDYEREQPYASAPVRSKPRRTYDPSRPARDPEGDYVPMYLASMYFRQQSKWKELKNALESFGKEAGLFDEISVRTLGKKDSEPFQMQVRKFGGKEGRLKGPQRNLIDVGYGVSQVLPVITELLRSDAPSMFLLQQPEVHLHPSAQAALGSLFCQVASRERRLVVETHSDYLLDRVRMDIRDSKTSLKPEDVSILFFERGDLDVHIHSLQVDREGNILNEPESYRRFFLQETQRSLGL